MISIMNAVYLFLSIYLSFTNLLVQSAPQNAIVSQLPGFTGTIPSKHYAGYVTLDKNHGKKLYYYYVLSERDPSKDPVVLWLNGGPGCSSFDGFVFEQGPFNFEKTGSMPKLHLNPYAWNKVSNMIFLDAPAGVGMSYSKNKSDYITSDTITAKDSHKFLLRWFKLYPEYLSNPFYIAGESFAGIYIPTLSNQVIKGINNGEKPTLNFKGYIIGNGVCDDVFDGNAFVPFARGMGLISEYMYQDTKKECNGTFYKPPTLKCEMKLDKVDQHFEGLNMYNIIGKCFHGKSKISHEITKLPPSFRKLGKTERPHPVRTRMFGRAWPFKAPVKPGYVPSWPELLKTTLSSPCNDRGVASIWLNKKAVREAIHADPIKEAGKWELCTDRIKYNKEGESMINFHKNITARGYRALIFSGDHDLCVPYTGTEAWTKSLGYKVIDEWRSWKVNGQVAGYIQGYEKNLTFLTVKGAGHTNAIVSQLPGFTGIIPSKHYAGYVTLDKNHGKKLYYYYVLSERDPSKDPVVLWLNGGPGCSSLNGFVYEQGPFNFEKTGSMPNLHLNPYAWNKVSNVIYLDSPAGVGMSYSRNRTDYITSDTITSLDSHKFLLEWFQLYPEYLSNPFFIAGESFAGIYIPVLSYQVIRGLFYGEKPTINFKGYIIGNGVCDGVFDGNAFVPFARGMGLISEEMFQDATKECNGTFYSPPNLKCEFQLDKIDQHFDGLNFYNILGECYHDKSKISEYTKLPMSFRKLGETERPLPVRTRMFGRAWPFKAPVKAGYLPSWPELLNNTQNVLCNDDSVASTWLNNEAVRKAVHADPISEAGKWELCTSRLRYNSEAGSMIKYHKFITGWGYRALIFSGDHDLCVPYTGTEAWTQSLGYKVIDEWRSWKVDGQVAGYLREYDKNLTFLTVKGSGHTVPEYKPKEALAFYSRWYVTIDALRGKKLYYYYVLSERNPSKDPVVLWLNGGPGCSSFDGFVYEHGPFNFQKTGGLPKLHLNPYAWNKVSNMIFLDSPVGVGMSYSRDKSAYNTTDTKTALDSHKFLLEWFKLYPEYLSNPFYIAGESFAGIYIPTLSYQVVKGLEAGEKPTLNFKGYIIGNGICDDAFDGNGFIPFVHGMGLISNELHKEVNKTCKGKFYDVTDKNCKSKLRKVDKVLEGLNMYNILIPCFHANDSKNMDENTKLPLSFRKLGETQRPLPVRTRMFGRAWPFKAPVKRGYVPSWPEILESTQTIPCIDDSVATRWLNDEAVRVAIHADPVRSYNRFLFFLNSKQNFIKKLARC
ncbi:hypothetical protein LXL04_000774 [Taraxacum kok-saghyz]